MGAFEAQKDCARSCFVLTDYCSLDVLGSQLGCKSFVDCSQASWQAVNDCYCRSDLQKPAQDFLTSCISELCTVGDPAVDASSAGSIYAQYCQEKGYSPAAKPATVPATATKGSGVQTATAAGSARPTAGGAGPTATSTTESGSSSSGSSKLSMLAIIGIVVGSLAGLAFLVVLAFTLKKLCGCFRADKRKQTKFQQQYQPLQHYANYQQPIYPTLQPHSGPFYSKPNPMDQEVLPDDSISMVAAGNAMPRPAPTLVSVGNYPQR